MVMPGTSKKPSRLSGSPRFISRSHRSAGSSAPGGGEGGGDESRSRYRARKLSCFSSSAPRGIHEPMPEPPMALSTIPIGTPSRSYSSFAKKNAGALMSYISAPPARFHTPGVTPSAGPSKEYPALILYSLIYG